MNTINIAIADDHPIVTDGLQNLLHYYPHLRLIAAYTNAKDLLEGLKKAVPDVLLLDIEMPDKTGDEITPVILKHYPDIKILALTNYASSFYASNMFKRGAHGYVLKSATKDNLVKAIETVYNGGKYIEPSLEESLNNLSHKQRSAYFSKNTLTPREKEILQLIVDGLTMQEIADKIHLGMGTVMNYRTSILLKLDANNTAVLVKKAIKYGWAD